MTCASKEGLAIDFGRMTGGAGAVIGASCSSSHTYVGRMCCSTLIFGGSNR
jgi:hypothetical protein